MRKVLFTQVILIICFFTASAMSSNAQSDPNNDTFLIAGQVKFLGKDSVKFYLSDSYQLAPASCANYYMIAKVNRYFQLEGLVKYYYVSNNQIAAEVHYRDGHLLGLYYSFYPDGDIKSEGIYYENQREGKWEYFYDKNKMWKVVRFSKNGPLLDELYKKSGKQVVKDGNGKFEGDVDGTFSYNFGDIKNGLMDGKWILRYRVNYPSKSLEMTEFYSDGKFIKGISNSVTLQDQGYTTNPQCTFIDKDKLSHMDYYSQSLYNCDNKRGHSVAPLTLAKFFPDFKKGLTTTLKDYVGKDTGWICVMFHQSNDNKIKDVNTYTIINDNNLTEKIKDIMMEIPEKDVSLTETETEKRIDQTRFFYVLIENKNFVIPQYVIFRDKTPEWLKSTFKKYQ